MNLFQSYLLTLFLILQGTETLLTNGEKEKEDCGGENYKGSPRLVKGSSHIEAGVGDSLTLPCRVCLPRDSSVTVMWEKDGQHVTESKDVRSYRRQRHEYVLRVRQISAENLGNYSCSLVWGGLEVGRKHMLVSLDPPPPVWEQLPDRVKPHEQVLGWTGSSRHHIINYSLEFRLAPVSGLGEDWINIIVPFQNVSQQYKMRGLNEGTEYQARLRSRTRHGVSPYSQTLSFSTFSEYTFPTMFSMSREEKQHVSLFRTSSSSTTTLPSLIIVFVAVFTS